MNTKKHLYAQFFAVQGDKLTPATGLNAYQVLDGRLHVTTNRAYAAVLCRLYGFVAYQIWQSPFVNGEPDLSNVVAFGCPDHARLGRREAQHYYLVKVPAGLWEMRADSDEEAAAVAEKHGMAGTQIQKVL